MNSDNPYNRRRFAEKLAFELERSHVLIDYGYIVIWLDRAGWYNHATIFSERDKLRIVISRFSDLRLEISDHYTPIVGIACQPSEAMDLTGWIVQWSRSNEDGREPSLGDLCNYTKLPVIEAQTPSVRAITMQNERDGLQFLRKRGGKA